MARLAVVIWLLVGAVAVGVWLVTTARSSPDDGRGAAPSSEAVAATAEVEERTLRQTIVTRGAVVYAGVGTVTAFGEGRVTAVARAVGDRVDSGDLLYETDGRPTVAADVERPFWRSLRSGDEGSDVVQLQRFLTSAGHLDGPVDGRFGDATRRGLIAWQQANDFADPDGILVPDDMAAGPWPARVASVEVEVGALITPGVRVLGLSGLEPDVLVTLSPGQRQLLRDEVPGSLEVGDGRIIRGVVDPATSTTATDSAGNRMYELLLRTEDAEGTVVEGIEGRVTLVVRETVDALAVPLVAVVGDGQSGAAVRRVATNGSVEVVPVELGLSEGAYVAVRGDLMVGDAVVLAGSP